MVSIHDLELQGYKFDMTCRDNLKLKMIEIRAILLYNLGLRGDDIMPRLAIRYRRVTTAYHLAIGLIAGNI